MNILCMHMTEMKAKCTSLFESKLNPIIYVAFFVFTGFMCIRNSMRLCLLGKTYQFISTQNHESLNTFAFAGL